MKHKMSLIWDCDKHCGSFVTACPEQGDLFALAAGLPRDSQWSIISSGGSEVR